MNIPSLRLAVQYASDRPAPERRQVRRWVRAALAELVSAPQAVEAAPLAQATLTVRFVDADEGRTLNRTFRGKDYATNVLTFEYDAQEADGPPGSDAEVGRPERVEADVVICLPVVENEAATQRKPLATHTAHLVVHGTLHACGLDHETPDEADAMERLERRVLARFGIDDPYREPLDAAPATG